MPIRSILALTDFSLQGEHALDRAAQLAVAHQVPLRVMYFDETPHPGIAHPDARLAQRARQLARRHPIVVQPVARGSHGLHDVIAEAENADLLVLDPRAPRHWLQRWQSTPLARLLRHCRCPVLVVRHDGTVPYARMLVAVDFSPASKALVRFASGLGVGELQLFHAISTHAESRLRSAQVRTEVLESWRSALRRQAQDRIVQLSDSLDTRRNRVAATVGSGDPARQALVQQEAIAADLLVVGKARCPLLLDLLRGSVAQRLAATCRGDLLVVPHDHAGATQARRPGAGYDARTALR